MHSQVLAGGPEPRSSDIDGDAELDHLSELTSNSVISIPIECASPPFGVGQTVVLTIGNSSDGTLCTEALVESIGTAPDQRVRLRLHSPIRRQQRRTDVRLPLDVPTRRTLRLVGGSEPESIRARVLDISAGGVLLETTNALRTGDRLLVAFTLPGDSKELRTSLLVRHSRVCDDSAFRWESGCQFQVVRPADRERIARYIFSQQRDAANRRRALGVN